MKVNSKRNFKRLLYNSELYKKDLIRIELIIKIELHSRILKNILE
jgi:hypothetical protein